VHLPLKNIALNKEPGIHETLAGTFQTQQTGFGTDAVSNVLRKFGLTYVSAGVRIKWFECFWLDCCTFAGKYVTEHPLHLFTYAMHILLKIPATILVL